MPVERMLANDDPDFARRFRTAHRLFYQGKLDSAQYRTLITALFEEMFQLLTDPTTEVTFGTFLSCWAMAVAVYGPQLRRYQQLYDICMKVPPFLQCFSLHYRTLITALMGLGRQAEAKAKLAEVEAFIPIRAHAFIQGGKQERNSCEADLSPDMPINRFPQEPREPLNDLGCMLFLAHFQTEMGICWFRLGEIERADLAIHRSMDMLNNVHEGPGQETSLDIMDSYLRKDLLQHNTLYLEGCAAEQRKSVSFSEELRALLKEWEEGKAADSWADSIYIASLLHDAVGEPELAEHYLSLLLEEHDGHLLFYRYIRYAQHRLLGY